MIDIRALYRYILTLSGIHKHFISYVLNVVSKESTQIGFYRVFYIYLFYACTIITRLSMWAKEFFYEISSYNLKKKKGLNTMQVIKLLYYNNLI